MQETTTTPGSPASASNPSTRGSGPVTPDPARCTGYPDSRYDDGRQYFVCTSVYSDRLARIQPTPKGEWGTCRIYKQRLVCIWYEDPVEVEPGESRVATPAEVFVRTYVETIAFPAPDPYVAPGKAITGLMSFMENRSPLDYIHDNPHTPFGPLLITATSSYEVDWGDGTTTGPHRVEGRPWPNGAVTHTFINIGTYDIVVTQTWTTSWTFGDETGVIDGIVTTGSIEDFPVGQIQAVVVG